MNILDDPDVKPSEFKNSVAEAFCNIVIDSKNGMVHIMEKNEDLKEADDDKKNDKKEEVIDEQKINDAERNHGKIVNYDIAKDKSKNNKPFTRNEYLIEGAIHLASMQLNNVIIKASNQLTIDIT